MKKTILPIIFLFTLCFYLFSGSRVEGGLSIVGTAHNLSVTGPGEVKALSETRICIFCHTPHNSTPSTPLWNREIEPRSYTLYSSSTMEAPPAPPNGPSRLCLSCHDGTLALGAVLQPAGGIETIGEITLDRPSFIGTTLTNDHPFSISYAAGLSSPFAGLDPALGPNDLPFYGGGSQIIECSTCHDAHADLYLSPDKTGRLTGKFLVMSNRGSAFCIKCHGTISGWITNSHNVAIDSVGGVLPVPPRLWPTWPSVQDWACESCHTSHTAGSFQGLLYYEELQQNCVQCHDGSVSSDIEAEIMKSGHMGAVNEVLHSPVESVITMARHVECVDCHNPHTVNNSPAMAPQVSGSLQRVSGVTRDGTELLPVNQQFASYEYEICFRCHADYAPEIPFIPRVVSSTNTRLQFSQTNQSFHPVVDIGKNANVPSLIQGTLTVPSLNLSPSSIIYCSDCHDSDISAALVGQTGPRGPHGSIYPPILRERYETSIMTPESYENYSLCYRCHDRNSILGDVSFRRNIAGKGGHSGHLAQEIPCSACHDAHGVETTPGTGDHTHLINFDIRMFSAGDTPIFNDKGIFTGSCNLVCHMPDPIGDVTHADASYP